MSKTLNDFADPKSKSWADADQGSPRERRDSYQSHHSNSRDRSPDKGRGDADYHDDRRREERPQRSVPSKGPYKAFLANLSWDVREEDIEDFFYQNHVNLVDRSVELVWDKKNNRPKGFGYVECKERIDLEDALKLTNMELCGRAVRIDVAEERREDRDRGRGGDRYGRDDRHGGGRDDRYGRRNDRGWGSSGGRDRYDDRRNDDRYDDRRNDDRHEPREREPSDRQEPSDKPASDEPPKQRTKLQLLKRSEAPAPAAGAAATTAATPKSNPFGAARPREEVLASRGVKSVEPEEPAVRHSKPANRDESKGRDNNNNRNNNDRSDRNDRGGDFSNFNKRNNNRSNERGDRGGDRNDNRRSGAGAGGNRSRGGQGDEEWTTLSKGGARVMPASAARKADGKGRDEDKPVVAAANTFNALNLDDEDAEQQDDRQDDSQQETSAPLPGKRKGGNKKAQADSDDF